MSKRHWIAGNGSIGCLYDNCEVFRTKKDAIEYLADFVFDDIRGIKTALRKYEIFYFSDYSGAGADYCEISPCECDDMNIHSGL